MKTGMNPAAIEEIDRALKLQIDLLRHSANTEARIVALLEQMRRELIAKLSAVNLTAFSKARLNEMLKESALLIDGYYKQAQAILAPTYEVVSGISAAQTVASVAVTASMPSRIMLETLIKNTLIEGSPAAQWWSRMSLDTAFKFSAAIRQGIVQGETQSQIYKRVNLITDLAGRNSKALVHTAVMQVANDARMAAIETGADETTEMEYVASLDTHTCVICAPRDRLKWFVKSKEPIGHDMPWLPPPLHFSCRCVAVERTRFSDRADEIGQRAATGGPVSAKTTFSDFLARQTPEWQNESLGKGRADLYRRGIISLRDLVDGRGAPLSLSQLQKKYT